MDSTQAIREAITFIQSAMENDNLEDSEFKHYDEDNQAHMQEVISQLQRLPQASGSIYGTAFDCVDGEHGCYTADQPCGCPCDNCHDDTEFRCKVCNTLIDTQMSAMLTSRSLEICEDCRGGE